MAVWVSPLNHDHKIYSVIFVGQMYYEYSENHLKKELVLKYWRRNTVTVLPDANSAVSMKTDLWDEDSRYTNGANL